MLWYKRDIPTVAIEEKRQKVRSETKSHLLLRAKSRPY